MQITRLQNYKSYVATIELLAITRDECQPEKSGLYQSIAHFVISTKVCEGYLGSQTSSDPV